MNKIIRLNIKPKEKLQKGGGAENYLIPTNLVGHKKLLKSLESIKVYKDLESFILINKKTISNIESEESFIPAPRKRFVEDIKFVFGENKLIYNTTYFSSSDSDKNIHFVYDLSYDQIEDAIFRLKLVDKLLKDFNVTIENIGSFFTSMRGNMKDVIKNRINQIAKENKIVNFSTTKIYRYLSSQEHQLESFRPLTNKLSSEDGREMQITFSSVKIAEQENKKMREKFKFSTEFENPNDPRTLFVKGHVSKETNLEISGAISIIHDKKILTNENKRSAGTKLNYVSMFEKTPELETIVGIIDGGLSNGVVKDFLYSYEDSISMGLSDELPTGNHAEEVASLLLFADQLSEKTKDNLKRPKVAMFNVVDDDITYIKFKRIIKRIVEENAREIKIWNLSINFDVEATEYEVSDYAVFLDKLQRDNDVIFVISTGNDYKKESRISPPSDSFKAISVSALNSNLMATSYTKKGRIGVHTSKPDISIFGGDKGDEIMALSNNIKFKLNGGTSYAVPLVVRLVANLFEQNFSLLEIPPILSSYSSWFAKKNNFNDENNFPNGVLPIDNTELFTMIKNKLMWVSTVEVSGKYRHGFYSLKFPKFEEGYDFKCILSYNVEAKFATNSTYEYILDSTVVKFGRLNPFESKTINLADTEWINAKAFDKNNLSRMFALTESSQRIFKGKYKSRDTIISWPSRNRASTKLKRNKFGNEIKDINNWGLSFRRDIIHNSIPRKEIKNQLIAIAFIGESSNKNFYDEFIDINNDIVSNVNITSGSDDITFTD